MGVLRVYCSDHYITYTTRYHSPEECAFIDFSCTVWTKMRSLAGSLADGVLADNILLPPGPPIPPTDTSHQHKEGKGSSKKVRKLVTQKQFTRK